MGTSASPCYSASLYAKHGCRTRLPLSRGRAGQVLLAIAAPRHPTRFEPSCLELSGSGILLMTWRAISARPVARHVIDTRWHTRFFCERAP
jgi:hypothetical protein